MLSNTTHPPPPFHFVCLFSTYTFVTKKSHSISPFRSLNTCHVTIPFVLSEIFSLDKTHALLAPC